MLGVPVRVGVPMGMTGLADSIDTPPYATSVGLLRWGTRHGLGGMEVASLERDREPRLRIYDRVKGWLREFLP
jgi:cell division protein FtsA